METVHIRKESKKASQHQLAIFGQALLVSDMSELRLSVVRLRASRLTFRNALFSREFMISGIQANVGTAIPIRLIITWNLINENENNIFKEKGYLQNRRSGNFLAFTHFVSFFVLDGNSVNELSEVSPYFFNRKCFKLLLNRKRNTNKNKN